LFRRGINLSLLDENRGVMVEREYFRFIQEIGIDMLGEAILDRILMSFWF
jgi:hypothetical protein